MIGVLVFCLGGAIGAVADSGGGTKTVKRTETKTQQGSQKVETQVSTVTETQSVEAAATQKTPESSAASGGSAASSASAPAPAPPKVAKCDTAYAPQCLDPDVSDYDCQGEGDGPYYVQGPVSVVGNDHYQLDTSDHDGVGCE